VINVPVAAVLVLVAVRRVPESREAIPAPMDWLASVLAVAALAAVTYVLTTMPGQRSASALSITVAVIALGASVAFLWHERHSEAPMLPVAIFRSAPFVAANLVTFFVYGAFGAFSFVFTVALETISGYSPVEAGSTLLPITIIALLLSGRSGQLAARIGPRLQVTAGPLPLRGSDDARRARVRPYRLLDDRHPAGVCLRARDRCDGRAADVDRAVVSSN
jgi:nitrate/nitrite transporter NarK